MCADSEQPYPLARKVQLPGSRRVAQPDEIGLNGKWVQRIVGCERRQAEIAGIVLELKTSMC
jgi:hypothetical protein